MKWIAIPLVLLVISVSLLDFNVRAGGPASTTAPAPPRAVADFLKVRQKAAKKVDWPAQHDAFGDDFREYFTCFFWTPAKDFRDGTSPAWLVCYSLGDAGHGIVPVYRGALIDHAGKVLLELSDRIAGEEATIFPLKDGRSAAAIAQYGGRYDGERITVVTLEKNSKCLFDYGPPQNPTPACWESTLYFLRGNQNEADRIAVERQVFDYEGKRKWKERLLFRLDRDKGQFVEAGRLSAAKFNQLLVHAHNSHGPPIPSLDLEPRIGDPASDETLKEVPKPPTSSPSGSLPIRPAPSGAS